MKCQVIKLNLLQEKYYHYVRKEDKKMPEEKTMSVETLVRKIGIPQLNVEVRDTTGNSLYHGKAANIMFPVNEYPARRVVLVIEADKIAPKDR